MKILVLGAGRMGFGAVFDLAHNSPFADSITVADADFAKAQQVADLVNSRKVSAIQLDVSDYEKRFPKCADTIRRFRVSIIGITLSFPARRLKRRQIFAIWAEIIMLLTNSLRLTKKRKTLE
jgi:saccharopine dehydrogenase-like NADP-dependent oxidoreductase